MSEKQIGCRKKVLVLTAFDASFPDLDDLGEPFISVIRNRFQVLSEKLRIDISLRFIIDGQVVVTRDPKYDPMRNYKMTENREELYAALSMYSGQTVFDFNPKLSSNPAVNNLQFLKPKDAENAQIISIASPDL